MDAYDDKIMYMYVRTCTYILVHVNVHNILYIVHTHVTVALSILAHTSCLVEVGHQPLQGLLLSIVV